MVMRLLRLFITMNSGGLSVEATMQWLNVTRSYVYQLVRKNSLKALKLNPLVISTGSVIERIEETYPLVAQKCHQILNYSVKQDATHEFK